MEEDLGRAGPIVYQGSEVMSIRYGNEEKKGKGVEPASSLATDSLTDCER